MDLTQELEVLIAKFIINNRKSSLTSLWNLFFYMEEAYYFYTDFLSDVNAASSESSLPAFSQRDFSLELARLCPLTVPLFKRFRKQYVAEHIDRDGSRKKLKIAARQAADEWFLDQFGHWLKYKSQVPVYGAILINTDRTKVLCIKGYEKAASWAFPKGKINADETPLICATREVYEEIGFDITELVNPTACFETKIYGRSITMFIVSGVDEAYPFASKCRKEVHQITWLPIAPILKAASNIGAAAPPRGYQKLSYFANHIQAYLARETPANPKPITIPAQKSDISSGVGSQKKKNKKPRSSSLHLAVLAREQIVESSSEDLETISSSCDAEIDQCVLRHHLLAEVLFARHYQKFQDTNTDAYLCQPSK